jgi:methyltransferase (TIGR00027 family)
MSNRNHRTENDSWDITSGVGATALGMACARAHETAKAQSLFADPYARIFLDEAIRAGWNPPRSASRRQLPGVADPQLEARTTVLMNYAACRTAYFDQFLTRANHDEVRQVVVLGAGLDSRPWRLQWTPGTVVYEIDQPQVLEFKLNTLWTHNVDLASEYRPVLVDLRLDWPAALRQAGFDPFEPSAWSAEGLLSYLPPTARQSLFERIHTHSAPGSRIAVETASPTPLDASTIRRRRPMWATQDARSAVGSTTLQDIRALWFPDRGDNFAAWLTLNGWQVNSIEANDLMAGYDRAPGAEAEHATPHSAFIDAFRP